MKHFFLSSLFFLFSVCLVHAQSFSLKLGEEFVDQNFTLPPSIFATDNSGYYLFQNRMAGVLTIAFIPIRLSKESSFLRKFDENLREVSSVAVELGKGRLRESAIAAYAAFGHMHLFSTRQDKINRKHLLFQRPIDKENLSYPEEGNLIAEVSYDGFPKYKYANFRLTRSRDSSKILLHYNLPTLKEAPDKLKVHVFNEEMIPLWDAPFTLPYPDNQLSILDFKISNEGRVYVLAKYWPVARITRNNQFDYSYKLFVLTPGFEQADEYELGFQNKPLSNLQLEMEPDDDILCIGSYLGGEGRNRNTEGVFFFRLNGATLEKEVEKLVEIPSEMRRDMLGEDLARKTERKKQKLEEQALNSIYFKDIVLRSDGGLLLIGEVSYSYTRSYYVSTGRGTGYWEYVTVFVRGDILTINLDGDAELESMDRIRKSQRQENSPSLLSYGLIITRDKLRFLFNDRIENLKNNTKAEPTVYSVGGGRRKQMVTLASIDGLGNVQKEAVISVKEAEMFAFPVQGKQISRSEMIFVLQKGKRRKLAKLDFN